MAAACGLKSVSHHQIEFVVPPALSVASTGTTYPLVLLNNGTVMTTTVTLVPARPDIYNVEGLIGPGGRTKIFNVTNRVHTTEPFTATTISVRPFGLVPSVLRVYLTGAAAVNTTNTTVRIGEFGNFLIRWYQARYWSNLGFILSILPCRRNPTGAATSR